MAESRLLIIGQANMELSLALPHFPLAGESITSDGVFHFSPGGRAGQCAVCAARLGSDVLLCTRLGNDSNGRILKGYFDAQGVDTRFIKLDRNRPTALLQTISEPGKESRKLLFPGAAAALSDEDLEDAFMAYPDGVLLHFDQNAHLFSRAASEAASLGIPVFADATGAAFDYPMSMPKLEAIVLGEEETFHYTDIRPDCLDNYVRAAIRLNARIHAKYFIIRLKGRGTFFTDGKYSEIVSHPEMLAHTPDVPDVFSAALATELLRKKSMLEAVRRAGALSALLSGKKKSGEATVYPTDEELSRFCREHGIG